MQPPLLMLNRLCQTSRCDPVFAEKTIKISDENLPRRTIEIYTLSWWLHLCEAWAHFHRWHTCKPVKTEGNGSKNKNKLGLCHFGGVCGITHTTAALQRSEGLGEKSPSGGTYDTGAEYQISLHSRIFSMSVNSKSWALVRACGQQLSFLSSSTGASIYTCRYMYISIERYPYKHINACLTTSMWQITMWRRLFSQETIKKWTRLDAWVVRKVI